MTARFGRLPILVLSLATLFALALVAPAGAQVQVPDITGHGQAIHAPTGEPSGSPSLALDAYFAMGLSRMAVAVEHWSFSTVGRPIVSLRSRTGGLKARASR
jgi:hypothetical protein